MRRILLFMLAAAAVWGSLDVSVARAADKLRVVAEPGGAAAFAALLSGKYAPSPGERVAVLISGANTTAVRFD